MVEEIRRATGNPQVQLRLLDISSMASVRDFARRFLEEGNQLHILVNNAGVTGNGHWAAMPSACLGQKQAGKRPGSFSSIPRAQG